MINGNEEVLHTYRSSRNGASPTNWGHRLFPRGDITPPLKIQATYIKSRRKANWILIISIYIYIVSILSYGCTTWTLTKRIEKKLADNCTRMLRAILNKSWKQHPIKQQLYGHLPPISKTIQIRWSRHSGHSWRSKDELISNFLLWTPFTRTSKCWTTS